LPDVAATLIRDILASAGPEPDSRQLALAALERLREWSGCEAAAVRLREGDDFPFFETLGFPAWFVALENSLCIRHPDGARPHDTAGRPVLDCMCGAVLSGRFDPSQPFFTERGSFWTNSATESPACGVESECRTHTRDRCRQEGYESVALIPLVSEGHTFGLIHLSDKRRDRFTAEAVAAIEDLAAHLAPLVGERRVKDALRESLSRYQALFDSMMEGVAYCRMLYDEKGRPLDWVYLDVNTSFATLTGIADAVGKRGTELFPRMKVDNPELFEIYGRVAKSGIPERFEIEFLPLRMWLDIAVSSPAPEHFVALFEDISDRKRTEQALLHSENLLRSTMDNMMEGCQVISHDWRYLYLNDAVETQARRSKEDLLGRSFLEVWSQVEETELFRTMKRSMEDREPRRMENLFTFPGGEEGWFELMIQPVPQGILILSDEITTRLQTQTELREREEQLRQAQKMEAVGQLAGGIAHDFNNVLTSIIGYSDLILGSGAHSPDAILADVEEIRAAAIRASTLTRQILAFSRRQALRPEVLQLNDVLNNMERLLSRTLGEDVELITRLRADLGLVEIDSNQFEQVLLNLAVNARDAMPEGGSLTLETVNVRLGERYSQSHPGIEPGEYVVLTVSDTGHGMDEATLSRAFEPFFTTKDPGKGTGLGLSTVYGVVRQSGGSVDVRSAPGEGTTFSIYLPQVEREADSHPSSAAAPTSLAGTETILVVEDEPGVRALAVRILEKLGYLVLAAAEADEALGVLIALDGAVDLLLTDVILPGSMRGDELAEQATALRPDLPVLYMSGYARDTIVHEGRLDPGVNYLEKPFTAHGLASRVRELLDQSANEVPT